VSGKQEETLLPLVGLDRLPRKEPKKVWGSHGNGNTCVLCGNGITTLQMEYELQFEGGQSTVTTHADCYWRWRRKIAEK